MSYIATHLTIFSRVLSSVFAAALIVLLSGCGLDLNPFDSNDDNEERLPGRRISVLALERALRPDLEAIDTSILLPRPLDSKTWPQAGGFSHHAMHHTVLPSVPQRVWRSDVGTGSSRRNRLLAEPVVAGGRIFAMDAKANVTAFNANTGSPLWRTRLAPKDEDDGAFLGGGLAYENGRLFASTGFGQVVAMDATRGIVIWRADLEAPVRAAPAANGGRVFAISIENKVVALAATDGQRLWNYSGVGASTILMGSVAPAVDGGVVIAPFSNGEIAALRVDNGAVLWSDSVIAIRRTEAAASLTDLKGRPVIDRGRVYAVGHSGLLVSIDLRTGQRIWDVPVAGVYQPWIAGDYLYAISIDAEVVCVDVRTGQILWVTQLQKYEDEEDEDDRIVWAGPVLGSDRLIVTGSNERALAISPYNGEVLGQLKLREPVTIGPVIANATLYLLDDDGELSAYR